MSDREEPTVELCETSNGHLMCHICGRVEDQVISISHSELIHTLDMTSIEICHNCLNTLVRFNAQLLVGGINEIKTY